MVQDSRHLVSLLSRCSRPAVTEPARILKHIQFSDHTGCNRIGKNGKVRNPVHSRIAHIGRLVHSTKILLADLGNGRQPSPILGPELAKSLSFWVPSRSAIIREIVYPDVFLVAKRSHAEPPDADTTDLGG